MNNRKILTLEEVLNLKERPTLQMMVDLSVEDYTKYLYHKGVLKYIPQNCKITECWWDDFYQFEPTNIKYNGWFDEPIVQIKGIKDFFDLNNKPQWERSDYYMEKQIE